MEHNNLTSIAYARPIIYAEGLFASCYLEQGEFVPEEGISQTDLWNILSGEILKSGSDLVEDYALKSKLTRLHTAKANTYEMDQFPKDSFYSSCNMDGEKFEKCDEHVFEKTNKDTIQFNNERTNQQIQLLKLRKLSEDFSLDEDAPRSEHEIKLREAYEKQVSWIMGDDGDEFVSMETFSRFTDALILLDVLKQFNVPSVVSFLARRDEPIALTFSKTKIGLDCLMFCLFQA